MPSFPPTRNWPTPTGPSRRWRRRSETGKAPGTDLREGIPTLPLLFAAERDEVVRSALAGGSCEGVLERVTDCGALERAQTIAHEYADKACSCLTGDVRSRELAALAQAVVERRR